MQISTQNHQPLYTATGQEQTIEQQKVDSNQPKNKLTTDTVSVNDVAKKRFSEIQSLASQYNVNAITDNDMGNLSKSLYDMGEISLGEHAVLTSHININRGDLTEAVYGHRNGHSAEGERDYLKHFSGALAFGKSVGAPANEQKTLQSILDTLMNLSEIKESA